jgi:hypothetical protein
MDPVRRALSLAALACAAGLAFAQADTDAQVRIKAAFLYKFGGFVEWPEAAFAGPQAPLVIGTLGADALADELERVTAGRRVQERAVAVRRLRQGEKPEGVNVLFIGESQNPRLAEIAAAVRGQPVLVVSESASATTRGSMINFVVEGNRVRFDVALAPAVAGHLKISARLLGVARRVLGVS